MNSPYKRPPIVEAIVEVRFAPALKKEQLQRLQTKFQEDYPAPVQRILTATVEMGPASTNVRRDLEGHKLTSADGASVVLLGPTKITTSRLAPYQGWELLIGGARANWDAWKRVAGRREITRIGVRYINRIDIPTPNDEPINLEEFLTVSPRAPGTFLPPFSQFAMNVEAPLGIGNCKVILNVGSAPSPLVKTASFVVDLDLSLEKDLPQSDDKLWSFIDGIREHKNRIFEASITDRARELFS